MHINFHKYQGTGNDFVMLDDRDGKYQNLKDKQIEALCNRRFGIGADGLILLRKSVDHDFEMVYYNSDGRLSSMCGNGGRCILRFGHDLGMIKENYSFKAIDGLHHGVVYDDVVSLQMKDVEDIRNQGNNEVFLDTGSPHHVIFTEEIPQDDFLQQAKSIRYNDIYQKDGVNVNYVKSVADVIEMRTYERGVEDETLSCGTGVTAAALASNYLGKTHGNNITVKTAGGNLELRFEKDGHKYHDIWLSGPADKVFEGFMNV